VYVSLGTGQPWDNNYYVIASSSATTLTFSVVSSASGSGSVSSGSITLPIPFQAYPVFSQVDGNNVLWSPQRDSPQRGISGYNITTGKWMQGASDRYIGCMTSPGNAFSSSNCGTTTAWPESTVWQAAIDSSGDVWMTGGTYLGTPSLLSSNIVQWIGLATPVWPLAATGHPATMP
jgi:hypothetical protein